MNATPQSRPAESRLGDGRAPALRPYQHAAIAAIEAELLHHRSTLLVLATGLGKTVCFAELARRYTTRGLRVLVLAHRDELVAQAKSKLEALGLWVGIEQGKRRCGTEPVVVASPASLRGKRLASLSRDRFDAIIPDEAHHSVSPTWRAILDHFAEAKLIGVTATPQRADGKALGEIYESVAYRYELRAAIRDEWLVPLVARRVVVESVDLSGVATRAGDLAQDQLAAVMETERAVRGVVTPLLDLASDRRTLVFCVDVSHAFAVAEAINRERPGCAVAIHGEMGAEQRAASLARYERGEVQFICNVMVLTEGFDSPATSCIAMVRPTKSLALYMQAIGRGGRLLGATLAESVRNGKRDCLLLDFTGSAGRHRLVGPADCLAGGDALLPDDVAEEVGRLIGTRQLPLDEVLVAANDNTNRRRGELAVSAVVTWHADEIDPFVGDGGEAWRRSITDRASGDFARPTADQLAALDRAGVTVSKLPPSFSARDAGALLGRLAQRRAAGLCSLAQARHIARAGIDTRQLTFERAKELCTMLRMGSWRPQALWATPEAAAARARTGGGNAAPTLADHEATP